MGREKKPREKEKIPRRRELRRVVLVPRSSVYKKGDLRQRLGVFLYICAVNLAKQLGLKVTPVTGLTRNPSYTCALRGVEGEAVAAEFIKLCLNAPLFGKRCQIVATGNQKLPYDLVVTYQGSDIRVEVKTTCDPTFKGLQEPNRIRGSKSDYDLLILIWDDRENSRYVFQGILDSADRHDSGLSPADLESLRKQQVSSQKDCIVRNAFLRHVKGDFCT